MVTMGRETPFSHMRQGHFELQDDSDCAIAAKLNFRLDTYPSATQATNLYDHGKVLLREQAKFNFPDIPDNIEIIGIRF